jgi:hypothetical protein
MLSDLGDQDLVLQGDAPVIESNRHHHGRDQGVEVDGGLSQEHIETVGSLDGDHGVSQHRVHPTGQNVVDALDIVAEVAQLETTPCFFFFPSKLYLFRLGFLP